MTSLYSTLNLPPDATPDQIRDAYRAASRRHHPDTGDGDHEAFSAIQRAAIVLRDPEKRRRYDAGEDVESGPDNKKSQLVTLFVQAFDMIFANARSLETKNLIADIKLFFAEMKRNGQNMIEQQKLEIKRFESAKARITFKGEGTDFLTRTLDSKIIEANRTITKLQLEGENADECLKMAEDYDYQVDPPFSPPSRNFYEEIDRLMGNIPPVSWHIDT